MVNYYEIIKALKVIKEMCSESRVCKDCPCGNAFGECSIMDDEPKDWKIVEPEIKKVMG